MWARLSRFAGLPVERIEQTVRQFEAEELPGLEQQPGFAGVTLAVDWKGGRAAAITYWDSEEDLKASDKLADQAREKAQRTAQVSREPIVDRYEVVLSKP